MHHIIFALQNLTYAHLVKEQEASKTLGGKEVQKPDLSPKKVIKHLLSAKFNKVHGRVTKTTEKPLRVFDSVADPFIDLEEIDFTAAFKSLKKYFVKRSNWLQIAKFYLKKKPDQAELDKINRKKLKVTFVDKPIINRVGEDLPEERSVSASKGFYFTQSST